MFRVKKQNFGRTVKNQDQKTKNRNRPQTGRSKNGRKSKSASPRNKIVRLASPHPNQDISNSTAQTPRNPEQRALGADQSSPDSPDAPHLELDDNKPAPISWIDDVLEPSKIENPDIECPLGVETVQVATVGGREQSNQEKVDFLDANIIQVASKLSNELLQAVSIEEQEDNVLNTGFNAGSTRSLQTGNTNYSSRVECREMKAQPPPAPTSIPPAPEAIHSKSSVETRQISNVTSNLTSKMTSKSSIQSQRSKSSRNQSVNDLQGPTGSNETATGSTSKSGSSKNGNKKRVSKKIKRKKNSRSSIQR